MKIVLTCLLSFLLATVAHGEDRWLLHRETQVVLADVETGRAAIATPDRFTQALTQFDLECRLATNQPVTVEDLLRFNSEQVLDWNDADREKLLGVVNSARQRLAELNLPLPPTILVLQTTGREEGDAAYCRRHAIVLPKRYVAFPPDNLERLFLHELFHVLSSHNEQLRTSLYAIIGFRPCPEPELPPSLAARKITNPDAPTLNYFIELESDGQRRQAIPLLYSATRFDPARGGSLFQYLKFGLLVVNVSQDRSAIVEQDGAPLILDPQNLPSYHQQIGRNTGYIIHPDEILADNFVHLVMRKADLPNPEIVAAMDKLLQAQ